MKTMPPAQITRLDIARAAGVDPALIRYYFGNKSKLMVAAVLRGRRRIARSPAGEFRQRGIVRTEKLTATHRSCCWRPFEDPSLHHLIIERIIHSKSKEARQLRQEMVYGACKELAAIIEQGVECGELRRVDPRHLFLAMVGACSFPMAERALFGELMGGRADAERNSSLCQFCIRTVSARAADEARKRRAKAMPKQRQFLTIL